MRADMFDLGRRRGQVIGASRWLGQHFARVSAGAGAAVTFAVRGTEDLDRLAGELRTGGSAVATARLDVGDAGKQTISETVGTAYVSSADSFAMVRGGSVNASILGAMEVSGHGDLSNWMVPGKLAKGPGGAINLVGVRRVIVSTEHVDRHSGPKFRRRTSLPLTATDDVDLPITKLTVFERSARGSPFGLVEIASGLSRAEILAATEAGFEEGIAA